MRHAWIYSKKTGRMLRTVTGDDRTISLNTLEGESSVDVFGDEHPDTHYIRDGAAVEKRVLSPSLAIDGMEATISGLPSGLTVLWDGVEGVTDDDPLELDHDEPGTYTLRIYGGAPYLDTELEVALG